MKDSSNSWISTCAVFWERAHDLLEFISAYRLGSAITVEAGYIKHLLVSEAVNQKKYVNIALKHSKVSYCGNMFLQLQEWRMN